MEDSSKEKFPFDLSTFPFDDATCSILIQKRRGLATKKLFIDALLESAGVNEPRVYFPPRHSDGLRLLHEAYTDASEKQMWKDCITLYLLRWWPDKGLAARNYQIKRYMSQEYGTLSRAYYHMDKGEVKEGISMLCDPRIPTMHSNIVMASLLIADPKIAYPLIRRYVHCVRPPLTCDFELRVYMSALSHSSLGSAWEFQRSFPESEMRVRLIVTMIEEIFLPIPKPKFIKHLIAFPFSEFEENVLHELALEPTPKFSDTPSSITLLHDLVVTRLITLGQPARALQLENQLTIPVNDEEFAKEATTRRRELIGEAAGRDSSLLYSMDVDEAPRDASTRLSGSSRGGRPITPRRSLVPPYSVSTPMRPVPAPAPTSGTSQAQGKQPSLNTYPADSRTAPNTSLPNASSSRFATPPRHALPDLDRFIRSQGAPSPVSPSALKLSRPPQPTSPLASVPRGVGSTKNAFYDPAAREKPDLWGEGSGLKSAFRLSAGGSLENKKSPLSQVVTRESTQEVVEIVGDSMDEVDKFVINGARRVYKPPTPPSIETTQPLEDGPSSFRIGSNEIRSKKEAQKEEQRGIKRIASSHLELPGSFPRLEHEPSTTTSRDPLPPLSKSRRKARERTAEAAQNASDPYNPSKETANSNGGEREEMEERDSLHPLPATSGRGATTRSSRRKRASSVESDASDTSESQLQKVRRSTRLSATGSDVESVESVGAPGGAKRKARQGSSVKSAGSAGTGTKKKGRSKA